MKELLTVQDLNVEFNIRDKGLFSKERKKQILFDVSFSVGEGEIVGLVGESGSGKSTIAKAVLGLIPYTGNVIYSDAFGKKPQMVFQDPASALNPAKRVGWLLEEALFLDGIKDKALRKEKALEKLELVGLSGQYYGRFPNELSGGQRQRVSIALALMQEPRLLIADEPVSALDVTIQAQVLSLLDKLQESMGLSILFISHDLRVVYNMCDRLLILKGGRIVEEGTPEEVYKDPKDDYTKLLLSSIA